jgi:hypothetical protein
MEKLEAFVDPFLDRLSWLLQSIILFGFGEYDRYFGDVNTGNFTLVCGFIALGVYAIIRTIEKQREKDKDVVFRSIQVTG